MKINHFLPLLHFQNDTLSIDHSRTRIHKVCTHSHTPRNYLSKWCIHKSFMSIMELKLFEKYQQLPEKVVHIPPK